MTELEKHLLNALEQLQQDYMQRLNEWESAFVELQKMFSLTQRDNAMLNERVMKLSQQVQHLSERTERLRDERLMQEREHELSLERERKLDGPSLGW
jgi:predicted nuclease with TOPRIM domain